MYINIITPVSFIIKPIKEVMITIIASFFIFLFIINSSFNLFSITPCEINTIENGGNIVRVKSSLALKDDITINSLNPLFFKR